MKTHTESPSATVQRIRKAAREEFIRTGLAGARMQAIADRAGVNKALLHYYFRSKQNLYQESLREIAETFWGNLETRIDELRKSNSGADTKELIRAIISTNVRTLASYPDFPAMMLREAADGGRNLSLLAGKVFKKFGGLQRGLLDTLRKEMRDGKIVTMEPAHLALNIMGMCMIAFLMRPVLEQLAKGVPIGIKYDESFVKARIESIEMMVERGIFVQRKGRE